MQGMATACKQHHATCQQGGLVCIQGTLLSQLFFVEFSDDEPVTVS